MSGRRSNNTYDPYGIVQVDKENNSIPDVLLDVYNAFKNRYELLVAVIIEPGPVVLLSGDASKLACLCIRQLDKLDELVEKSRTDSVDDELIGQILGE